MHNDNSCLRKDNMLVAQASAVFNICRSNNIIFKVYRCKKWCNKIHIYLKNCNLNCLNNVKIILDEGEIFVESINTGSLNCGEEKFLTLDICDNNLIGKKINLELYVGSDSVKRTCIIL